MKNLWHQLHDYLPIAALLLLCMIIVPAAQANTNNTGNTSSTAGTSATTITTTQQKSSESTATVVAGDTNPANGKQKVNTKPREKSVLDAEVLESPMAYFKNAFSSEEDSAEAAPSSDAVMLTVKALVATLLSTIM